MQYKLNKISKIDNATKKLFCDYYKDVDFSYWHKKARQACQRIAQLKRENNKLRYYLELYTDYLQLAEVTAINIFAATEINPATLFESSSKIKKKMEKLLIPDINHGNNYLRDCVMPNALPKECFGHYSEKEAKSIIEDYVYVLRKSFENYLKDYNLLNAFKHGLRLQVSGQNTVVISLDSNPSQQFVAGQYDASVNYYTEEKDLINDRILIMRNTISFNHLGIYENISFMTNLIENIRTNFLGFLEGKDKVHPQILRISDRAAFLTASDRYWNKQCKWILSKRSNQMQKPPVQTQPDKQQLES